MGNMNLDLNNCYNDRSIKPLVLRTTRNVRGQEKTPRTEPKVASIMERIRRWWNSNEYDIETNVCSVYRDFKDNAGRISNEKFTQYNFFLDRAAKARFKDARWYNFFTNQTEIVEKRNKFIRGYSLASLRATEQSLSTARRRQAPQPPQQPQVEQPPQQSQDAQTPQHPQQHQPHAAQQRLQRAPQTYIAQVLRPLSQQSQPHLAPPSAQSPIAAIVPPHTPPPPQSAQIQHQEQPVQQAQPLPHQQTQLVPAQDRPLIHRIELQQTQIMPLFQQILPPAEQCNAIILRTGININNITNLGLYITAPSGLRLAITLPISPDMLRARLQQPTPFMDSLIASSGSIVLRTNRDSSLEQIQTVIDNPNTQISLVVETQDGAGQSTQTAVTLRGEIPRAIMSPPTVEAQQQSTITALPQPQVVPQPPLQGLSPRQQMAQNIQNRLTAIRNKITELSTSTSLLAPTQRTILRGWQTQLELQQARLTDALDTALSNFQVTLNRMLQTTHLDNLPTQCFEVLRRDQGALAQQLHIHNIQDSRINTLERGQEETFANTLQLIRTAMQQELARRAREEEERLALQASTPPTVVTPPTEPQVSPATVARPRSAPAPVEEPTPIQPTTPLRLTRSQIVAQKEEALNALAQRFGNISNHPLLEPARTLLQQLKSLAAQPEENTAPSAWDLPLQQFNNALSNATQNTQSFIEHAGDIDNRLTAIHSKKAEILNTPQTAFTAVQLKILNHWIADLTQVTLQMPGLTSSQFSDFTNTVTRSLQTATITQLDAQCRQALAAERSELMQRLNSAVNVNVTELQNRMPPPEVPTSDQEKYAYATTLQQIRRDMNAIIADYNETQQDRVELHNRINNSIALINQELTGSSQPPEATRRALTTARDELSTILSTNNLDKTAIQARTQQVRNIEKNITIARYYDEYLANIQQLLSNESLSPLQHAYLEHLQDAMRALSTMPTNELALDQYSPDAVSAVLTAIGENATMGPLFASINTLSNTVSGPEQQQVVSRLRRELLGTAITFDSLTRSCTVNEPVLRQIQEQKGILEELSVSKQVVAEGLALLGNESENETNAITVKRNYLKVVLANINNLLSALSTDPTAVLSQGNLINRCSFGVVTPTLEEIDTLFQGIVTYRTRFTDDGLSDILANFEESYFIPGTNTLVLDDTKRNEVKAAINVIKQQILSQSTQPEGEPS